MTNIEPIYQELAGKITKEDNKALPRVLKMIANLEQAGILRELPDTVEAIAKKLALDEKKVKPGYAISVRTRSGFTRQEGLVPGESYRFSKRQCRFGQSQV